MIQNAENVPHTAIKVETPNRIASYHRHRPVIAIFAEIGPMTQMTKAEKEPRNAIRELNCGIRIETRIDMTGTIIRSSATRICFVKFCGEEKVSKPNILSNIMFSYVSRSANCTTSINKAALTGLVLKANFDLMTNIQATRIIRCNGPILTKE